MLICREIKNLLDKWKRTPSSAVKQNGVNVIFWWRIPQTEIWGAIPREISICLLCSKTVFCKHLLLPVVSVDFSRVSWTLGLSCCRRLFGLRALCPVHVVKRVSPWNTQTSNGAVFHLPSQPLYSKREPKATDLLLCMEWKSDKREERRNLMIVEGYRVSLSKGREKATSVT